MPGAVLRARPIYCAGADATAADVISPLALSPAHPALIALVDGAAAVVHLCMLPREHLGSARRVQLHVGIAPPPDDDLGGGQSHDARQPTWRPLDVRLRARARAQARVRGALQS